MDSREMVNRLNQLSRGFQHSQIVFAALRGDVFSLLQTPSTAASVAAARDWSPRGARMLLDGLVALNLAEKDGEGQYRNTEVSTRCLVPGAPDDQTHILRHQSHAYETWGKLDESVRTGGPVKSEREERSDEELHAFILGMADLTKAAAQDVVDAIGLMGHRHVLDLGTGPGAYSIAFLKANPELRATLFDMPPVVPIAQEQVEKTGVADRCAFITGDLMQDPFGTGYDLVFASNIIHSFNPEENQLLVRKSFDALEPGGLLAIKDFLLDEGRTGTPFGLVFAIHMLLHTPAGDTYACDEVAAWTDAAGFKPGRMVDLGYASRIWLVEKP